MSVEKSEHGLIAGGYFGLLTTEKYQNNWISSHCVDRFWYPEQCYSWEMANGFGNVMDDHNTKLFSSTLNPDDGAYLQENSDHLSPRGADLVDVLYLQTHGGLAGGVAASYAMWLKDSHVYTNWMRLGDDGRGLKLFVSYACHTMRVDDYWWNRLSPMFLGGLKIMVGSHDLISWGRDMHDTTSAFAGYMLDPTPIDYAWFHSNSNADMEQDVALAATGRSCEDCFARMGRTYDELLHDINGNMPVLRDGAIGCACITWADDQGG